MESLPIHQSHSESKEKYKQAQIKINRTFDIQKHTTLEQIAFRMIIRLSFIYQKSLVNFCIIRGFIEVSLILIELSIPKIFSQISYSALYCYLIQFQLSDYSKKLKQRIFFCMIRLFIVQTQGISVIIQELQRYPIFLNLRAVTKVLMRKYGFNLIPLSEIFQATSIILPILQAFKQLETKNKIQNDFSNGFQAIIIQNRNRIGNLNKMRIAVAVAIICLVNSVALECGSGSVPNNQGICVKPSFIQGCFQYESSTKCFECSFNYLLGADGKCQYQTKNTKLCCKTQSPTTGLCEHCQNGLFLIKGKCVQKRHVGCLAQDQKGNCLNCAKKYMLQNGSCKEGVLNCASYINLGDLKICDQCQPGNSLINNGCLPDTILGCKDQVDGICKDCYNPFLEKDSHCEVPNCQSHNEFGCVSCECGYYLTADRQCNQISQGCIRYNRGICTDCIQHFQLKGGVCDIQGCLKINGIKCVQCKEGYENTQLGCKLKHCLISKQSLCEVCEQGYHHKEGLCVESIKSTISHA